MTSSGDSPRPSAQSEGHSVRTRAEGEELRRLNRTLRALSNSSQAMLRATDEATYLERVCRVVVDDCGHAMVWIGYAEGDADKTVRPVAHAGLDQGYLKSLRITWADGERGRGPTGVAIRTGKPSACKNMLADPRFAPWREEAIKRGYASSIVFPLMSDGKAFGAITIYSREPDPFSDDEQRLLAELSDDLAYGITSLRARAAQKRAEEALRDSEQRVRLKLDSILSPAGDIGNLELPDIIDTPALQSVMDDFHELAGIPMAVIDLEGEVLVGVGWQDICTKFHRVHPETCKHCIESDTQLTANVPPGEVRLYRCKNNMWDIATPLSVGGHHVGNVFMGQFFFDDEPLDYDLFRAQARRYGFDEEAYLAALEAVPRLSRDAVAAGMAFFRKFADMLSKLSYSNISLARNAAEREALLSRLRESKERLEESDRRKNEFLGVLSHELRNPLSPIQNAVYVLDRAPPGGEQAQRAKQVIGRQVRHLTRLVDDLLDVTRIAHGKIQLRRTRVELSDLVRQAVEDHRAIFAAREISLSLCLDSGPQWIDADATRILQVIGNLLQNAAKFADARARPGHVTVRVERRETFAEVRVTDDGVGISAEELPHLFQPFRQADESLHRSLGGLGLGLALVKGFVEMHGGRVGVRSDGIGHGAEFTISLPVLQAAPERSPSAEGARAALARRRVLVVEDNLDCAETLKEVLEMNGQDVEVAHDGLDGVARARALGPDIVFCDLGLPMLDGFGVARRIRAELTPAPTLVAVSGYARPEDRRAAIEAGFDHHLGKPLELSDLEELLARVTAKPRV